MLLKFRIIGFFVVFFGFAPVLQGSDYTVAMPVNIDDRVNKLEGIEWPNEDNDVHNKIMEFLTDDGSYSRAHGNDPDNSELMFVSRGLTTKNVAELYANVPEVLVIDTKSDSLDVPNDYVYIGAVKSNMAVVVPKKYENTINSEIMANALAGNNAKYIFNGADETILSTGHYVVCQYMIQLGVNTNDCMEGVRASEAANGYSDMIDRVKIESTSSIPIGVGVRGLGSDETVSYATIDGLSKDDKRYPLWVNTAFFIHRDKFESGIAELYELIERTKLKD